MGRFGCVGRLLLRLRTIELAEQIGWQKDSIVLDEDL